MAGNKITIFTDLEAWKQGHSLVLEVYSASKTFPRDELFALTSQMRRSVVSVTSNIAEGFSRGTYRDKAYFYSMALGSLTELQNQLFIARDLKYISGENFTSIYSHSIQVHKLVNGLLKYSRSQVLNT